jgi:dihydrofolate reductase
MTRYIYIAASLDGFIADANGGLDWLINIPNPEQSDYGFAEFMEQVDAVVMGRNTFEQVMAFGEWPYTKTVFVLSRQLQTLPAHLAGKAELLSGQPAEIVERLGQRGYRDLYVDGGVTIQSFLKEDLIDQMILTQVPILLGAGFPLFGQIGRQLKFEHLKSETLPAGLVKNTYRRVR